MTSYPDERWMVWIAGHVTMADWGLFQVNAYAERGVRSTKDDVRSRLMLLGERSCGTLCNYHEEYLHQSVGHLILMPAVPTASRFMARRAVAHGMAGCMMPTSLQSRWHDRSSALVAKHTASTRRGESAMQYTLILTEKTEGGIQVTIPALPACRVEAATRDEAIRLAREAIAQTVSRSEIVQIDIPQQPRATAQPRGIPWEWFGEAKADPTWDALFDDLEQRREATRDVE